jgi:hypothetical protein
MLADQVDGKASCDVELAKGETTIYFLRLRARNDAFAKLVPMMEGPLALRASKHFGIKATLTHAS